MHQSLQMVTRVHFTLSTATHDNSQWIRSPLAVPADSLLSIDDTVHPKLCGKCTMNTQLALEASNQMKNKLRDSFTKLLYTAGTGGIRFS